jgi:hypothetical protein
VGLTKPILDRAVASSSGRANSLKVFKNILQQPIAAALKIDDQLVTRTARRGAESSFDDHETRGAYHGLRIYSKEGAKLFSRRKNRLHIPQSERFAALNRYHRDSCSA